MKKNNYIIYTDGGARGNPGPAGIGAVIIDKNGYVVKKISEFVGRKTNNQAEYLALIFALQETSNLNAEEIHVHMDSELIVKQVQGKYRVKNKQLKPLFDNVIYLLRNFNKYKFTHIPRVDNTEADKLVNYAINKGGKSLTIDNKLV